ncbi:hypothetical protein [Nonomuraea sp. NPDC050202]|uniref:hypothetical protein n=1 Tax=Nonomuraea sp. NPDC050202 TaxID=3155035 RepID=UPI0033FA5A56
MTRTETKGRKCDGKRRHNSKARALAAVAWHVARGAAPGALTAYACEFCDGWHVGHRPTKGRRRRT